MTAVVLDASALLAMLHKEPGGEAVRDVVARSRMGVVNFAEVVSHLVHTGVPAAEVDAALARLQIEVLEADIELARAAGRLRGSTAAFGLSLGDRFCLALGARDRLPVWTADRQWRAVAEELGVEIVFIR
jgi:PIN domain nuclease of toxin-antitoxin system